MNKVSVTIILNCFYFFNFLCCLLIVSRVIYQYAMQSVFPLHLDMNLYEDSQTSMSWLCQKCLFQMVTGLSKLLRSETSSRKIKNVQLPFEKKYLWDLDLKLHGCILTLRNLLISVLKHLMILWKPVMSVSSILNWKCTKMG